MTKSALSLALIAFALQVKDSSAATGADNATHISALEDHVTKLDGLESTDAATAAAALAAANDAKAALQDMLDAANGKIDANGDPVTTDPTDNTAAVAAAQSGADTGAPAVAAGNTADGSTAPAADSAAK